MVRLLPIFAILAPLFIDKTNGGCVDEGVMVVCETVEDFAINEELMWKDVTIKSDVKSKNYIEHFTMGAFKRVENLAIVGKTIGTIYSGNCFDIFTRVLTFYDNKIPVITSRSFRMRGGLDRLRLANNQIEELKSGAFAQTNIKSIDLSNNLLDLLVAGTFTKLDSESSKASATEIIYLRNNRISYIEANTFPQSLRILNLDNNQLTRLDNALTDLDKLQILYLNHNKLRVVPDFRHLKVLEELDLSHNQLKYIEIDTFKNFTVLRTLDLSYNQLSEASFLPDTLIRGNGKFGYLDISLAFNLLASISTFYLENDTLSDNSIIFYGNPWDCTLWPEIEKVLNKTALRRSTCDLQHFGSGKSPFCVSYVNPKTEYYEPKFDDNVKAYFAAAINMKATDCELTLEKKGRPTLKLYRLDDTNDPHPCHP